HRGAERNLTWCPGFGRGGAVRSSRLRLSLVPGHKRLFSCRQSLCVEYPGGGFDGVGGCMRWIARGGVGRNHVAGGKVQTGVRSGRPATRTDWRGQWRSGWLEASEESEV